jgi:hypothetical protein
MPEKVVGKIEHFLASRSPEFIKNTEKSIKE